MQNRGSPVNRIPIMAKDVLDLFRLYQLVVEKGGLVEARAPWTMEPRSGSATVSEGPRLGQPEWSLD